MKNPIKPQLLNGNVNSLFFRYLGPSMTSTVMISINFFIDTLCIGQKMGERGLAALSIAQPALGMMYAFGYLFGIGGSTLYSIHQSRGEKKQAHQYYSISAVSILIIGGLATVAGLIFLKPITQFMGGDGSTLQDTMDYLRYSFMFAVVFCMEPFLAIFLRNDKAPRISMAATLISCSLNIVLDVYFVFVLDWGMKGAALATSLAMTNGIIVLVGGTLRKGSGIRPKRFHFEWKKLFIVIRSGVPSYVLEMTGAVVTLAFNTVLLRISGVTAVAVYGIIANLTIIATSAVSGVSNAMQPLVSANAGAGKHTRVRQILKTAIITAFCVAMICVLAGTFFPEQIIRFFISPENDFLAIARPAVQIASFSYLIVSANLLLTVYFQSVEANNEALATSILRGVILPVVCVIACAFYGGLVGAWFSLILSELIALFVNLGLLVRVQARLRAKNYYSHLHFFGGKRPEETIDQILDQLGAEDLTTFVELIHYCNSRNEEREGIPAYIGLDDLTSDYEGDYACAEQDEDMGLLLAVGSLLLADMYEQNETFMRDKQIDLNWPAAAPAMSALAEKCFRFVYDEDDGSTDIIGYGEVIEKFKKKLTGGANDKF